MSKYTTEVRYICERAAGLEESKGFNDVSDILDKAAGNVFNFSFPIFDEAYRPVLCKKILLHYYTREICDETVGLWKLRMYAKLNTIMPYYNQLYKSALLEFNPLYDADYWRKSNREGAGTGNQKTKTNNVSRNLYSDTPQGSLRNVESEEYLTNASKDMTDSEGTNENKFKSTDDYLEHVWGKHPGTSYSKMLKEFRETFLNIDEMIINELKPLFFNLW